MSLLHEALYAHLAADSGVSTLVDTRINFNQADEDDELPYIVMQQIAGVPETHLTGDTGRARTRVQMEAYARDYTDAQTLLNAIRDAIHTLKGTLGDGGVTIDVRYCEAVTQPRDILIDPPSGDRAGSDEGIFGVQQDYIIVHAVSIPTFA